MPKHKTHKGLKKRVKVTAKGKVKRSKAFASHLLAHKSAKRKRRLRGSTIMKNAAEVKKVKRLLGEA